MTLTSYGSDGTKQYASVNACLKPLLSLDGAAVLPLPLSVLASVCWPFCFEPSVFRVFRLLEWLRLILTVVVSRSSALPTLLPLLFHKQDSFVILVTAFHSVSIGLIVSLQHPFVSAAAACR